MVSAYVSFAFYYFQRSASLHLDTDSLYLNSFLRTADRTLLNDDNPDRLPLPCFPSSVSLPFSL